MPAGEVSHRPPGRLEGPCSPRHEALLAGAWKDLASLHRAALIRDHRRPRTASAWRPRALARRAALRWFGSFDSLCRRTPGGRGSQKWLRGPLPFGRGTASGTSSVATAARRAAARRCWRWWFEVGIVQSSVDESRASAGSVPCLCGKWQIYLFDNKAVNCVSCHPTVKCDCICGGEPARLLGDARAHTHRFVTCPRSVCAIVVHLCLFPAVGGCLLSSRRSASLPPLVCLSPPSTYLHVSVLSDCLPGQKMYVG